MIQPDLPNVLHNFNFDINPGEKVDDLTSYDENLTNQQTLDQYSRKNGSGKSTLALSFFRFVEPTEGRILADGVDTSKFGLTDLHSRLTIILRMFIHFRPDFLISWLT